MIKNVGLVWDDVSGRWFTPSDLLVAQGFRYDRLDDVVTNSFQITSPHRQRSDTVQQMGNSMHVNAIGAVIAFCLDLDDKDTTDSFQAALTASIMRKRRKLRN